QPLFSVIGLRAIAARDVVFDNVLEFFGDMVALQGDRAFAVDEYRRDRHFTRARQADADIGVAAFAWPVDHAAHDRHIHAFDAGITGTPQRHLAPKVRLDAVGEF